MTLARPEGGVGPLSSAPPPPPPPRGVRITAGVHAREWIGPATAAFVASELLAGFGRDNASETTTWLSRYEVVVVPLVNPDGYEYSWTDDRLWRKNRRPAGDSRRCMGVDLNRNADVKWGGVGASPNPCSTEFRGPSAASEPEVAALQAFVRSLDNRAVGVDLHAYGQLVLRSYGYTTLPSPNDAHLKGLGDGMRDAIRAVHGTVYTSERAGELYPTTGSIDDWFTDEAGMYGWTIELRDEGRHGFQLPSDQIRATATEAYAGLRYLAEQVWAESHA